MPGVSLRSAPRVRAVAGGALRHESLPAAADPAFVIVRLSQLALQEASQELVNRVSANLREFESAVEKLQTRAGRYVAAEFNEGAANWKTTSPWQAFGQRSWSRKSIKIILGLLSSVGSASACWPV